MRERQVHNVMNEIFDQSTRDVAIDIFGSLQYAQTVMLAPYVQRPQSAIALLFEQLVEYTKDNPTKIARCFNQRLIDNQSQASAPLHEAAPMTVQRSIPSHFPAAPNGQYVIEHDPNQGFFHLDFHK